MSVGVDDARTAGNVLVTRLHFIVKTIHLKGISEEIRIEYYNYEDLLNKYNGGYGAV